MSGYKENLKPQAVIADTIENLEDILKELKKCMQDCKEEIIFEENRIIDINNKKDS